MIKSLFFLALAIFLYQGCGQASRDNRVDAADLPEPERAFLDNLASLCGQSFGGMETYSAPGRESWAGRNFVMHVTVCEDERVYIPFHIDEDRSRTWMFLAEEEGLRFRHDHRHPDGTPEDLTMYGGFSDGQGTGYRQSFPADEYTVELLSDELGREWRVLLSPDMETFTYQLHYSSELQFEATFDLSNPL